MNKIFKVVWSKTKECYVVVSEVAKNNGGKKKALSTVFAALVAAGAMMPNYVDAANNTSGGGVSSADASIAIGSGWGNSAYANNDFSIAIGDQTHANGKAAIALGRKAKTNGEEASIAIGNETEATAKDSTAVGSGSKSSGEYAAALGFQTKATANYATAIGSGARGYAEDSQAIGREAETSAGATRAIAIGTLSKSSGNYATSLGSSAEASAERAIAVGYKSKAEAERAISVGNLANASKNDSIAVGNNSAASGLNASAVGKNSKASGQSAAAFGDSAQATNTNATAIGNQANASNTNTTAIGNETVASGGNATAIGHKSQATGDGSVAVGTNNKADYEGAAVGLSNTVTGRTSAAFGRSNTVSGNESLAAGIRSTASGEHNVAIGYQAVTNNKATVAIGEGSKADIADGVAIGSNSATTAAAGVQGFNPADSRTKTYGGLTGAAQTSTLGAVAVGNGPTATRQITGLAAGKEDTDAVNVAQLRSVNLKYAGDTGNSDVLLDNGTLNIKGDNNSFMSTSADKNGITVTAKIGNPITANTAGKAVAPTTNGLATTTNVADAINASGWNVVSSNNGGSVTGTQATKLVNPGSTVTLSAGKNIVLDQNDKQFTYSLSSTLKDIESIQNGTSKITLNNGGGTTISGGNLSVDGNKITNVAKGTDDTDAVNYSQIKGLRTEVKAGTGITVTPSKGTDGHDIYTVSSTATGGAASTESVVKKAAATGDTNIADVSVAGGKAVNDPGAQYEVSVSKNAVKDAAREAVTVNNGGNTDNPITVTPTQDNTNHNTTYAVTFDGNKAAKQIPLTYKATNGTTTTADQTVKLDKGLNFTGGDYTTASVGADGKVTFDVNLGTAPTVTDGKPGVPGQAGAAGKDGIATVKTVVDTINNSGWKANAKANGGTLVGSSTATVVKPGDQVNFAAGKNLTVKQDLTGEHTYTYSLNKDVDLTNAGSLTVGDTKVNNDGITIKAPTPAAGTTPTTDVKLTNTGLDNGGNKIVNVAEGTADTDAVNVKQLKDAKTVLADGKNTKKSGTGTAADPYKVNVEGDLTGISSITNGGTNNGKISFGPNKTVTVDGDHSITLNASTGKIGGLQNLTFDPTNFTSGQAATEDQLKSVHDTLKASELHIAPTESNRTGEHIAGAATSNTAAGAAANAYKYDATTKQVVLEYNDGTGANKTGTKAVIDLSNLPTGGDMSSFKVTSSAESTTVGTHAGDASQEIKNGKSVDFQAGKNMTVKQTNDTNGNTTINYALNKDLDVESVHVGKDGKDGKIGIDGKDGVDGLDGTNRVDIHVEKGAKGVDGTDGHDGVNGHNGKDGMTRIVYEDKGGKQEVATLNDGMKYAGDDAQGTDKTKVIAKKLNETLDIIGGANKADLTTDNIGVNNDGNGKLLVQLSKNLKGINTIKNGNTTITLNDTPSTTTPAVTITGGNLSLGDGTTNNKIVNVAPGTDDTDAVNVKQLKDAKTVLADGKNTKKSGTGTAADPYKVNVEGDLTEITSITNKADASGNAGKITFSPNQTVTVSGDHNISLNGKTGDITGLTNTTIPTTAGSDFATKGRAATEEQLKIVNDKFNNKINLGADGNTETTKLALDNNGGIKFNIKGDGSGASGANQYISTTASGSDIKVDLTQAAKDKLNKTYDVTSTDNSVQVKSTTTNGVTTFDLKVAPATGTTSTWDIKSSADTANGGATATGHETAAKTIANAKTVEMIAGKNLTVKQTSDTNGAKVEFALSDEIAVGKDGTNGIDGKIGVNGKDGASVVINGKDGSIGLTGPRGATGAPGASATLNVKDGVPGVDGAPGTNLTRIVYTDKNNVEHEVATHDDGMKFAGDDGQANQATNANVIKKHLNNVVDIIGGATKADLTTNNIGVNNDGNGKLLVQLSKNLNGINTIKNGGTTITLNDTPGGAANTPAVTIAGGDLSVGGNKITNVNDGKADTDAVNVKQLKAAKTEVKAGENVTVKHTTDATDNHNIYTVSAVTPAVYTKADGTKVYKIVDPTTGAVTWNTSPDGTGTVVNAGDVITSFETPANGTTKGSTTGGTMIVNNVGSAINNHATPGVTSPTYLDKLDAAAGDNNTKHAAVNVTDLKNTADGLTEKGLKFDANVGGVKTNKLGSIVKVQGAGTGADANYSGANIKTFIDQDATGNTTIDVKLDKNLAGINSITGDTNSGKLVFQDPTATVNNGDAFKFTGGNINAGGNNITNLKSGIVNNNATDDTNGANIGDVKKIAKASDLHIAPTAGTTNNVTEYTVDANNKVTLTYQDGNGTAVTAPKAVIDLSALANKITSGYTFNANATANGGTVANDATTPAAVTAVANGGTINYAAGKNLTVKQDIDTTNKTHTYTYSLDKDLTNLDKVVVNGKDGIAGKDGVTIVGPQGATGAPGMPGTNGIDGKVGIAGKDGKDAVSIAGKDGVGTIGLTGPQGPAGTNGKSVDISTENGTQTLVKPEANNNDQSQRIVYVPKDKDGNPLKDDAGNTIKREVATMDDGLKFAGDDGQANQATNANVIKKQLNNVVDIIGGATKADLTTNNIGVNNDGNGKLLVQLSKNLNGINTIKNGGTTITLNDTPGGAANTPAVTIAGGDLSVGGNKITNVNDGKADTDAVNVKQLKAAKTEVKAGENVTVKHTTDATDNHNIYTVSAVTPAVYTKADGTKVYKIVDPTTGAVTWNTSPDGTGTVVNAGDVITSFESPANGTTPGSTTGGNMIVNNVGSAIKNQTGGDFLAKLDAAANTTTGTPNAAVNVSDLKNTADALKANERHIAPTTVATGSTEIKGGTANAGGTNVYKYDAASKTVTLTYNDGNGNAVTDTKAVIDLSNLSTGGTGASSWNVKSSANTTDGGAVDANHNANAQNIADGKSVEFQSGKNLVVKQTNDTTNGNATVEFSLSDNITVGKDGANGKDGSVGAKGADGSAVVMNGKDGSIGLNGTNGANGISIKGKDGANGVGIDGKDGVTRIVYTEKVPDPANPGTTKEVTHEVATMDDGLKFTGNNTGTVNKHKLGSLVKVQGEGVSAADEAAFVSASGNIAVTAENNDTLTIRLNKNLKGLNSIQLGGNTIQSNGDNITFTTNGGTTKTVATTDQLWTIQANGTDVPATNGKVNVVGKDGITVAKNAAGNLEISGAGLGTMNGFDVTANNGATSKTIDNGKKVDFNAGSNLTVKQTNDANGTHIEYALKEAVDLGTNGSLKAGDTTVNKDGVTIANGPSITKTGVDAGNKKITNVADGAVNATSKDAVNGSQLKKYTDAAKTTVEAGDNNVKVETDTTAADGHTNYKVSLEPVVTIGDTHKVKIDGHTGDITGLTNVTLTDPTFATKGRAATEEQLKQVLTEAKNKAIEKVQAGTAAAGDTNIATVAPKAGDTFGAAGATYEVSVSKNAVKDAAKEAVKVTSASPAITVTADTSVAHETTYKVGFDGNQAATQIPLTYKQNGGSARTVKLSDGLNFIDGTNTKARTAADGKVTFDVMGDLTGITSISNAAGGPKMTFGGNSINVTNGDLNMGGNKITNLGKGTATTDAATVGQLTKVTSNNHSVVVTKTTDADGAPVYDLAVTGTPGAPAADPRVDMLGEEIGRVGAQGAALSALKPIQYDPLEPTQIMAGYGNYRGNSAVALGVAHYKNESTLIHGGVSWAGGSSHMMANAGVTWKVGNRDSEAAVADRYRKGPISSAYAMQQEMAAMKAQNAGLKGEVSDLKAENEQMKAQIAAMMAKLGL